MKYRILIRKNNIWHRVENFPILDKEQIEGTSKYLDKNYFKFEALPHLEALQPLEKSRFIEFTLKSVCKWLLFLGATSDDLCLALDGRVEEMEKARHQKKKMSIKVFSCIRCKAQIESVKKLRSLPLCDLCMTTDVD